MGNSENRVLYSSKYVYLYATQIIGDPMSLNKYLVEVFIAATFLWNIPYASSQDDYQKLGNDLYHDNCSVCHGDSGQGAIWAQSGLNPKPRNFTSDKSLEELNRKRMIFSATYGRPETAMQGWGTRMRPYEIEAVVDHIRIKIMNITQEPEEMDMSQMADSGEHDHSQHFGEDINAPLPDALTGLFEVGKNLYDDNCAACHGTQGDGAGPRSKFIFPKPRNFMHPAAIAKFSRTHIFETLKTGVNGTEMPAWQNVLSVQEMADISEYLFKSFIQPDKVQEPETVTDQQ